MEQIRTATVSPELCEIAPLLMKAGDSPTDLAAASWSAAAEHHLGEIDKCVRAARAHVDLVQRESEMAIGDIHFLVKECNREAAKTLSLYKQGIYDQGSKVFDSVSDSPARENTPENPRNQKSWGRDLLVMGIFALIGTAGMYLTKSSGSTDGAPEAPASAPADNNGLQLLPVKLQLNGGMCYMSSTFTIRGNYFVDILPPIEEISLPSGTYLYLVQWPDGTFARGVLKIAPGQSDAKVVARKPNAKEET